MIGIGHIGLGGMGRLRLDKFRTRSDLKSVIAWSRSAERLTEYEDGEATTDWQKVVDHPQVDAVCVATPTVTHVEFAATALEAGKHVLVEGPAVNRVDDFDRLTEMAQRNKRIFYCGSDYRFMEPCQAASLAAGGIGNILRAQMDSSWCPAEGTWYYDRSVSGGVFPCAHIFPFTFLEHAGIPQWVDASLGDDGRYGVAQIHYETGAVGISTGGFRRQATNEVFMIGTEGIMRREPDGCYVIERESGIEALPVREVDSVLEDNAAFVRCLLGEEDWETHLPRERTAHALAAAAQESAEGNKRVMVVTINPRAHS